jgi:hypothetical protein
MEYSEFFSESPIDSPAVRVDDCAVGKGVFAEQHFEPDWVIGEITGTLIDDPTYSSDYGIDMEDGCTLEPNAPFRFLNHSCEPNCEFEWFETEDDGLEPVERKVYLLAIEPIARGEQLTIDYNWPAEGAIRCQCQAATCRGWIVQEEELDLVTKFAGP